MDVYCFFADLNTSFRSSSDFIKAVWLLSPAFNVFALILLLRMAKYTNKAFWHGMVLRAKLRTKLRTGWREKGVGN